MGIVSALLSAGFGRVIVLDASECGESTAASIILALWPYEATCPTEEGAWIHPYYFASQQAYEAAASLSKAYADEGIVLRDDIRLKPIFARLPGFSQGRNTLSYVEGYGSRFHVQTMTSARPLPITHHLESEAPPLHCGSCHKCEAACPTNALEGGIFHRERCLRNWMMGGQPIPEPLRPHMEHLLIGCDACQQVCPHNAPPVPETRPSVPLLDMLANPKSVAQALRPQIGVNLTIPNRVLAQACLIAAHDDDPAVLDSLQNLAEHPSPAVQAHAKWAIDRHHAKNL